MGNYPLQKGKVRFINRDLGILLFSGGYYDVESKLGRSILAVSDGLKFAVFSGSELTSKN